jgi:Protein of unknown function (DUF4246)
MPEPAAERQEHNNLMHQPTQAGGSGPQPPFPFPGLGGSGLTPIPFPPQTGPGGLPNPPAFPPVGTGGSSQGFMLPLPPHGWPTRTPDNFPRPPHQSVQMDNSGSGPLKVPGFGLPLTFEHEDHWHKVWKNFALAAAGNFTAERMTKREVAMVRFMEAITDKPGWNRKVRHEEIVAKWWDEASEFPDKMISHAAFQWCIEELRDRAKLFEENGSGWVSALESAARVVKADGLISDALKAELRAAVQPLLDAEPKDWHPRSDDKVLNLVHPSLYPLVYGKTPVLAECGTVGLENCLASCGKGTPGKEGQEVKIQGFQTWDWLRYKPRSPLWSQRFQWLPAEVKFIGDAGVDVKIASYINNLYPPAHETLYCVIEKIISHTIPLWNHVLIRGRYGRVPIRIEKDEYRLGQLVDPPPYPKWRFELSKNSPEVRQKLKEYLTLPDNPNPLLSDEELGKPCPLPEDWETSGETNFGPNRSLGDAFEWKYERVRRVLHPEPGSYTAWKETNRWKETNLADNTMTGNSAYPLRLQDEFRSTSLQVIVKLSSIELTPDKPSYPGGNWHLEGMLNERIVGTAIYYYDVFNVTISTLRFRNEAKIDEYNLPSYEQDDHAPVAELFGMASLSVNDEPAIQEIGAVETKEGRMLAFPNTLQHKVEPFELIDKSKPGHRRFLVLWLVEPGFRIVSTANVGPQQKDLYLRELRNTRWAAKLPIEVEDMVEDMVVDGLMDSEEAKRLREDLMDERTTFGDVVRDGFRGYNLCEH